MAVRARPVVLCLVALAFSGVVLDRVLAGSPRFHEPVSDPVVKEECGGCHLAFAASMLPADSWRRMLGGMQDHFGDDASLGAATAERIAAYLVSGAGDADGRSRRRTLLAGLAAGGAPQRITELPRWVAVHKKVPDWEWRHGDVLSKANCPACHAMAEEGDYREAYRSPS